MATIARCGGEWRAGTGAGVTFRTLDFAPTTASDYVVSVCRHLKYSSIIRMHMMSTKMSGLYLSKVDVGTKQALRVSWNEICPILLLITTILLLHMCEHHLLHLDGYHNVGHKIPTDQLIHMYLYLYKFI